MSVVTEISVADHPAANVKLAAEPAEPSGSGALNGVTGTAARAPDERVPHPLPTRVDSLDGLRALAAGLVFFFHLQGIAQVSITASASWLFDLVCRGWVGVDLFYVLSGLFIGLAVMRPRKWEPWVFAKRRCRRILPAYYLSILILATLVSPVFFLSTNGLLHVLSHLTFTHGFFLEHQSTINGVYWTLGVEWWFYLLMLLVAPLLRSRRGFPLVVAAFLIVPYAWRAGVFYGTDLGHDRWRFFLGNQLPGSLDEFAVGIVLARWFIQRGRVRASVPDKAPAAAVAGRLTAARTTAFRVACSPAALGVAAAGLLGWCQWLMSWHSGDYWNVPYMMICWKTMLAMGFGLLIASFLVSGPWLGAALHWTGISYVGRISYSIYLVHGPVIMAFNGARQTSDLTASSDAAFALACVVVTLLIASVSYYLVELPWLKGPEAGRPETYAVAGLSAEPAGIAGAAVRAAPVAIG
ncbi:MAG: acyltransferase 3 [Phycisphaerales bacterium]|nr:acyltransferase 3 [Phycisphaerales bacterium]